MKKLILPLFAFSAVLFAKEVTPAPIVVSEYPDEVYIAGASKLYQKDYNMYLRVGGDAFSSFNGIRYQGHSVAPKKSHRMGFEGDIEFTKSSIDHGVEVGWGVGFQQHAAFKKSYGTVLAGNYETDLDHFTTVPVYFTAKYNFMNMGNGIIPYIKGDAGYAFNQDNDGNVIIGNYSGKTDVKNGGYYGIGVGMEYNNVTFDIMYKLNTGEIVTDMFDSSGVYNPDIKFDEYIKNHRVTLTLGYKFSY